MRVLERERFGVFGVGWLVGSRCMNIAVRKGLLNAYARRKEEEECISFTRIYFLIQDYTFPSKTNPPI